MKERLGRSKEREEIKKLEEIGGRRKRKSLEIDKK